MRKRENYFKIGNIYRSFYTDETLLVLEMKRNNSGVVLIIMQGDELRSDIYPPGCVTLRDLSISLWRRIDER